LNYVLRNADGEKGPWTIITDILLYNIASLPHYKHRTTAENAVEENSVCYNNYIIIIL